MRTFGYTAGVGLGLVAMALTLLASLTSLPTARNTYNDCYKVPSRVQCSFLRELNEMKNRRLNAHHLDNIDNCPVNPHASAESLLEILKVKRSPL